MKKLKVLDLFSGIGGFSLGLERTGGFETVAFCEIEEFPRKVLAKHWPEVPIYHDVRELTSGMLAADGIAVDVITGGFPCQDISVAGNRFGMGEGTRSGLWSEIVRLIGDLSPRYVIVENVANLLNGPAEMRGGWFGRVLGDLAECGYDAEWKLFHGYDVEIPQARPRVWIVAYPSCDGSEGILHKNAVNAFRNTPRVDGVSSRYAYANDKGYRQGAVSVLGDAIRAEILDLYGGRKNDGVPRRMDRYKSLGNSVIPQIPEMIGRAILGAT